ncbi:hypothetical protein M3M33_14555, partial [Loigolactobacillus coryniformis]|uniref:hypothetical protein n=1 Tax=Loigolactobacillus coryniformis TaxID=1610 RepID=UPI00201A6872
MTTTNQIGNVETWTDDELRQTLDRHLEPASALLHGVIEEMMRRHRMRVFEEIKGRIRRAAEEWRE